MKRIMALFLALICALGLSGCGGDAVLKSPPTLTVMCGEESIEALLGTYSWSWFSRNGKTGEGTEACGFSPLERKEHIPCMTLTSGDADTLTAYLQFGTAPDEISVRCWGEECWGQTDAEGEDIEVEYGADFIINLKNGNYIYEITAKWSSAEGYGGTAYYSFYTVKQG